MTNELHVKRQKSDWTVSKERTYLLLMAPALIVLVLVTILPFLYLFGTSLTPYNITKPQSMRFNGFMNYLDLMKDHRFWNSVWVQARLSFFTVILQIFTGLGVALLLNVSRKFLEFIRTFFIIPLVLPPIVVAIVWKVLFTYDVGIINWILGLMGLPQPAWLVHPVLALWTIIVADVWEWFPFTMLMILAVLQMIPEDIIEAAKIDGASAWRKFFYIILPLIRPVILVTGIFRLIDSIKAFPLIYVMTEGGPGIATEATNFYAYLQGLNYGFIGFSSTISVVMLAFTFALSYLITKVVSMEVVIE